MRNVETLQNIFPPWFYSVFDLHLHGKYLYCLDGIELETEDSHDEDLHWPCLPGN